MGVRDPKEKVKKLGKEFSPEKILENLNKQAEEQEKGKWQHSYKIEVITPIFGGGVKAGEPDIKMPVRASAIRGQLRYWWRFLAANRPDKPLAEKKLFEEERDIWGGMAEKEEDDFSSKVKIRINLLSKVPPLKACVNQPPQYALFPAREQKHTSPPQPAKELIWIDSNNKLTFELQLCVPEENLLEIEWVLRWWVTFGGIGARTRRGCGSVYCTGELEKLPPISKKEAEAAGCELVTIEGCTFDKATDAWERGISILQSFRQLSNEKGKWVGVGRKTKQIVTPYGKKKDVPSISRWPEANAIRRTTGKWSAKHRPKADAPILFPRAMFGMPLAFPFKSKSDNGTPPETELLPMKEGELFGRLASPLILKPMATTDGKFQPAALLMPYCHLCDLKLHLQYQNKNSANPGEKSKWTFHPDKWCKLSHDDLNLALPVKDNNSTDALTAFMNFFAKGGIK